MEMPRSLVVWFPFWSMLLISLMTNDVLGNPSFTAMYVFGDSLVDNGNNNYLNSLAKANFEPYGIDFFEGPTGRFSNGKTLVDSLGEILGLPFLPSFADTVTGGKNISWGVNYASAAAGIIDETGRNLGERISFTQQVQNFKTTLSQLKIQMEGTKLNQYLANSLTIVIHGNNDYINNYLVPEMFTTSFIYDPKKYADVLIEDYKKQNMILHGLGLRKFLLAGIGPLGCIPNQLAKGFAPPGECRTYVNDIVDMFNVLLKSLVEQLNGEHHGSIFVYGNTYDVFSELINEPAETYGFTVTDSGCCGMGRNQGQITCLPGFNPCTNRNQYVFWDAFHPTEAVNKILAQRAFNGSPSDCYPVNVKQMAQMWLSSGESEELEEDEEEVDEIEIGLAKSVSTKLVRSTGGKYGIERRKGLRKPGGNIGGDNTGTGGGVGGHTNCTSGGNGKVSLMGTRMGIG
ncbi:GDSL esterase/lipase At1g71250-like [Abrus precatorius]|uniref:GDSL esterase/lipase At1g71250-like n=1 Tax=Abrus precatorius TaxID=3816 RepID=A0A8B8LY63_ABRPR|nr:GDSL esterase/lipase At1g71250-like [Abrus precatorius]